MIRILFIILSLVAVALAVLLQLPLLYVLAGALLLAALVMIVSSLRRRHRPKVGQRKTPAPSEPAVEESDDDLASLGILEIRPKERGGVRSAEPVEEEAPVSEATEVEDAPVEAPAAAAGRPPSAEGRAARKDRVVVRKKAPSVHAVDSEASHRALLGPYLQALQAAVGAQTACLLKQEELALQYHIEAIVSENAYARSGGQFSTRTPLLSASDPLHPVTVRRVSEHDLPQSSLGYYRELIAVKQVAFAPVPHADDPSMYFLAVDTMTEGDLDSRRKQTLLAEFARLLGVAMESPERLERAESPSVVDLIQETGDMRPRRDIIAEEMKRARDKEQPLALALVYLNQAEMRADRGIGVVNAAETALEKRIRHSSPGRVERFGELTYGVFYNGYLPEVEAWAVGLQNELARASGPLEGGISIGIALLQDRHDDPDAFRADVTEALREAYESGTCTILE